MKEFKKYIRHSFYILSPLFFFMILYLFGVIIKCEFNISNWDESERILLASEGIIAMVVGFLFALFLNGKLE